LLQFKKADNHHFGDAAGRIFGSLPCVLKRVALAPFVSQLPELSLLIPSKQDMVDILKEFNEAAKITRVIAGISPLNEITEAIGYLQEGRSRGKIIITP
jgi:hypothetical protein